MNFKEEDEGHMLGSAQSIMTLVVTNKAINVHYLNYLSRLTEAFVTE